MQFVRCLSVRIACGALAVVGVVPIASAQSTLTLTQPDTQAWYATVRGGTHANKNLSTILETRSSTNPEYLRRALLKFDTHTTIPAGTSVASAVMTVTVKRGSSDATRRIGVYQVTRSWEDTEVTFNHRRSGIKWGAAGGDLGTKLTEKNVSNVAGTRVSFDITPIVQQAVKGQLGSSRYTRIALVDLDGPTSNSWRAYHTSSDSHAAVRPTLTVTYGSRKKSPTDSDSGSTTSGGKILRILHYNIGRNGWGTDNRYDPVRVVNWVVKMNPDIVSFNEFEKWTSWSQGKDGVALYKKMLQERTGRTWYTWDIQDYGVWSGKGMHSAVFSKIPFSATHRHTFSAGRLKTAGGVTINFNGRNIDFVTTHFDPYEESNRRVQAKELVSYLNGFTKDRIVAGDFNEQPGDAPIRTMNEAYYDAWAEGKKAGVAYSAPDNPYGNTRNSRIDYIFYSRQKQHLTLKKVQVVDTRDEFGKMPSDHRPVLAEFLVH